VLSSKADEPLSREDALAARLKTLRSQTSGSPSSRGAAKVSPSTPQRADLPAAQPPGRENVLLPEAAQPGREASPGDALDGLLDAVDEAALDEFLADLGDDPGDDWNSDIDAVQGPSEDAEKVAALLDSLGKAEALRGSEDDSDDSEGEAMKGEINKVLSQAKDEADWEKRASHQGQRTPKVDKVAPKSETSLEPPKEAEDNGRDLDRCSNKDASIEFSLPTVPTDIVDPVPSSETDSALGFEADIAARMAALRGLSTDAFGMPSVPAFQPADRPLPGVMKRTGYTDEDEKTWCVVCLEDATIRCVGCDDDVYCARCWRDMHVGPAAGFDERGHKWVKFNRQ